MSEKDSIFNKVTDTWDLKGLMHKNQLFFMYSGHFDDKITEYLLTIVEVKFQQDESPGIKRKVIHIMIELLQNISLHRYKNSNSLVEFLIVIGKDLDNNYFIMAGNCVENRQEENICNQIERINSMAPEGLKSLFRVIMEFGINSDNGGVGLGLINLVRRSRNKLKYNFIPVSDEYKFFTLMATIEPPYFTTEDEPQRIQSRQLIKSPGVR